LDILAEVLETFEGVATLVVRVGGETETVADDPELAGPGFLSENQAGSTGHRGD
jgi:hypothetical protein